MSNAYSLLSTGNTFGDWIVTTNALTKENNDFHANSYHKNGGTLYLDDASLGLQVNNQAIFAGAFQVTGAGSSATIQNNLTVQTGQIYFQNTELTLVASGLVQANGPNTGLYVANTANIKGVLNVTNNTFLGNNLNVVYNTTTSNSITSIDSYVGRNLNVVEKTFTDVLQANTSANTRLLTVTGSAYVNILQANSSVNTSQLTVSNNVTTSNVVATGSVYVTTNINAANIVSTNVTASGNIFSSNSFVTSNITTSNVVATGSVYVTSNVTTSNVVATGSVYVTSNVTTSNVVATGSVYVTTNINAANIISTNVTASGNIFSSNVFVTSNIRTSNIVATGVVTVDGNMGIGTNSPAIKLDVSTDTVGENGIYIRNVNADAVAATLLRFYAGAAGETASIIRFASTHSAKPNQLYITNLGATSPIAFATQDTERMRIDSAGDVTINNNLSVTNNVSSANVVTTKLYVGGTTRLVGTANTTADLGIGGNLNVPNVLFMGGSSSSANIYSLTVGQSLGNGALTVQGNFVIASPAIYQAPSFTLYGGSAITGGNFAYFNVNRLPGINASFRWSETNKEWGVANVDSGSVYRVVTDEYASGSSSSANSMTYPTSFALANANTFLQTYNNTANTGLKSYGDATYFAKTGGTISGTVTISSGGLISTASPIGIASGGTNNNSYTTGQVLQFNGSSFASLANVTAFSATGSSTAIPIITTDSYGRVTALSTASISTTLSIAGTAGTGTVALASQTLKVTSSTNTVTSVVASGNTITIADMASGVSAGSYGSSTAIPVLGIDTYGRVTSASTTGISTTITLAGGSGSGSVSGGGTLTLNGSTGLTTSVSGSTYTLTNSGVTSFSTSLTGLTPSTSSTGAITLAGTLGVASGGTGVTTSTGSGSVVLNNSPTFITPALGTPSSGTLTNCTFPTLNQNTTGTAAGLSSTLAVASGGTGVTTSTGTGSVVLSISPTFTGTVSGVSASMVGLGSVTNESKATMFTNPTFTGTVSGVSASMVGLGSVTNESKATMFTNPTFTGTVSGVSKAMVGLGSVDNTADASKSVSFATTSGNITAFTINQSVGSSNAPTFTGLTINGAITASGNITAYYSDKRLKNITGRIQNALGKINSISGIEYTQSKLAEQYGYNNYKPQVGVIAQEIQSILPEAVCLAPFDMDKDGNSKSGENYLTVQYEKLVPLLIEAIKELTLEVEALKNK
jgi:hypothetical protein